MCCYNATMHLIFIDSVILKVASNFDYNGDNENKLSVSSL